MVVADSPARAEDAVARIAVDWEPLPAVVDMVAAAEPGGPLVHEEWGTNVAVAFRHAIGNVERAFGAAATVFTFATSSANAAASRAAMSDNTFRSSSIPRVFKPWINWL